MNQHINNPKEYYNEYTPSIDNNNEETYILGNEKINSYNPVSYIELYKWKILKNNQIERKNNNNFVDNNNDLWETYSLYPDSNFNFVTLEIKNMIDYIIKDLKNYLVNKRYINQVSSKTRLTDIKNIYLVSLLKNSKFNIENHHIIRLLFKDINIEATELTILTKNNKVIDILYEHITDNALSFSKNSSLIPSEPRYTLEYSLQNDLGIVLSIPDKYNIYKGINLLATIESNSNIKEVKINTLIATKLEIYMINENLKFVKVCDGNSNHNINLQNISLNNYIKKNILIKILNFTEQNILYLSSITC